jgi:DNA gyrase subunit A
MAIQNKKNQSLKLTPLREEVESSYLDYAMSVIISRALPDVRDGLKPVHRRILYAMYKMGLNHKAKYKKSSNVIGQTLGKFHPHGDTAIYDALCRMTQDFSLRYPLIDGQGNFGSNEDAPAAHRYTECRLSPIASEMLSDLEKNVIPFGPNYDGTTKEPLLLPAKLPNLLVNGSMGIAVGMATNIPTHNLNEVCSALSYLLDHPEAEVNDLLNFIPGPDFPTGGIIFNQKDIKEAYEHGKGGITVRAKTEIIETHSGHSQIEIKELPWQVSKSELFSKIAELIRDKKIEGIKNARDESARGTLKIVIEIKKGFSPSRILNYLFKTTSLETKFYFNMVALGDGIQPKLFNLKEILEEYLKHRQLVIKRRYEFDLEKTKERIHILEGFIKAIINIDEVVKIIRNSQDSKIAEEKLRKRFNFSLIQAQAILEMKLRQLVNLEKDNLTKELEEKKKLKEEIEKILSNEQEIKEIIKKELKELKEKYGDPRRTEIIKAGLKEIKEEDIVGDDPVIIITTQDGYIKRMPPESFHYQKRGGKGISGLSMGEEDKVEHLIFTTLDSYLLCFTNTGKVYQMRVCNVPEAKRASKGRAIVNFLEISPQEKISAICAFNSKEIENRALIMATAKGFVKKNSFAAFKNIRSSGIIAIKLEKNDYLKWVKPVVSGNEVILTSSLGKTIRFKEKELRSMGRNSRGIKGIKISENAEVVGLDIIDDKKNMLLVISQNGYGKMTLLSRYRAQRRGGRGISTAKISQKTGPLIGAITIPKELENFIKGDLLIISELGQVIRVNLKNIPTMNRQTQGVRLIRLNSGDKVASITLV